MTKLRTLALAAVLALTGFGASAAQACVWNGWSWDCCTPDYWVGNIWVPGVCY